MSRAQQQEVSLDVAATGWDAHSVWRERVRGPQALADSRQALAARVATAPQGWDPHDTWRERVRRSQQAHQTSKPE